MKIKKTFTIETSEEVMDTFERFLALLHHNSNHGHSGVFAMTLDCDGNDKVSISPTPRFKREVDLCAGVGGSVEIAQWNCYVVKNIADMASSYVIESVAGLFINGDLHSTRPRR